MSSQRNVKHGNLSKHTMLNKTQIQYFNTKKMPIGSDSLEQNHRNIPMLIVNVIFIQARHSSKKNFPA